MSERKINSFVIVLTMVLSMLFVVAGPDDFNLDFVGNVRAATTNVSAATTDGWIDCSSLVSYADCRATPSTVDTTSNISVGQSYVPLPFPVWAIYRGAVEFDTSSIPDTDTITSANIWFNWAFDQSTTNFAINIRAVNYSTLTTLDWTVLLGGVSAGTLANSSSFSANAWVRLNMSAVLGSINRTGMSQYSVVSWKDVNATAPTTLENLELWAADWPLYDPFLVVTHVSPNTAPVITADNPDSQRGHNISASIQWNATDVDGDSLTWTLSSNLSSASIESRNTTTYVNFTATFAESQQSYYIRVTVSDGSLTDSDNMTMTIFNTAPVIGNEIESGDVQNIRIRDIFVWEFSYSDTNSDNVRWSISGVDWLEIDSSGVVTKSKIPKRGTYTVTITINDGIDTDTTTITFSVSDEDEGGKPSNPGKFDFICVQISTKKLDCEITLTRMIPIDRLVIDWAIDGYEYTGTRAIHESKYELVTGTSIWTNMTVQSVNGTFAPETISKKFKSTSLSTTWIILALFSLILITLVAIMSKNRNVVTFKKSVTKKQRKLKRWVNDVGVFGVLLIGLVVVFTPVPTDPLDPILVLFFISILGIKLYLLLSAVIIILTLLYFGKRIFKVRK